MRTAARRSLVVIAALIGVVAVAVVVASVALDAYVHRHQQAYLTQLESRIGRPVRVGRLSASLFTGIRAENVTIGGSQAAGDRAPLLTVERVRVRPALWRSLVSLGRSPQVADIELVRPKVNLVRFADGTLNVDQVAAHWRRTAPAQQPSQPMSARTRRMIENARLRHAHIRDGSIHFVDRAAGGGRAVDVTALALDLADVGIRRHPSIDLRAAVLAPQPNFALRAQLGAAGSLEQLPPPVESAQVTLARTDLAPLASLLSRVLPDLQAGVATIDLRLRTQGNALLQGQAQLQRARFAGGAPFDARLDADVAGDTRKGDLDVRHLDLDVAGMALAARGRLQSLKSQPRFENVTVASRNLDFDQLRRLYPRLDRALGAELHGAAQLGARASEQQLTAFVDLTNAAIAAPGRFEKPRGTVWRLDIAGRAHKNTLEIASVTMKVAQQSLRAHGTVQLGQPHPGIDAYLTTDGLSIAALSPLVPALAKAGLPPITVAVAGHLSGRAGVPQSMAVEVSRLSLTSRKTNLSGSLKVRDFARPQCELQAQSSYLDTADLLPAPSSAPSSARQAAPPSQAPSPLARVSGHAAIAVARGVAQGVPFSGLAIDATMHDGALHANRLEVATWGGQVTGSGSDLDVARGPFHLVGHVEGVDVEQMLARLASAQKLLSGRLSAQLDLRGRGTERAELQRSLSGTLVGTVAQAQLLAFNFDELLAGQLARALPFRLPTQRLANGTNLGTLQAQLRFDNGAITLEKPLTANTPEGPLQLAGRILLDGRLDLTGTLQLQPAAAAALFANRVRPAQPLPLSLRFAGDVRHPSLAIANLSDTAKVLVQSAVGSFIPGRQQAKIPSQQELQNDAVKQLKGLLNR